MDLLGALAEQSRSATARYVGARAGTMARLRDTVTWWKYSRPALRGAGSSAGVTAKAKDSLVPRLHLLNVWEVESGNKMTYSDDVIAHH